MITAVTATIVCQPTLKLAVESVHQFVPAAAIHVFMPEHARCISLSNVTWHDLTPANPHIHAQYSPRYWYSVFMTNPRLWSWLRTPYVLVFQADTLVCRPIDMDKFGRYDYIGGPSLRYGGRTAHVPWQNLTRPLVSFMNGGVALHRREWTLDCATRMQTAHHLNEDAKWNGCRPSPPVSALDALSFGSDNGFSGCFRYHGSRHCPTVVHKPWVHAPVKKLQEMQRHCPRLEEMKKFFLEFRNV
jgi:hypothetical protein